MTSDTRPELTIAQVTWDRAEDEGRSRLVLEAAQLGFKLVVTGSGTAWSPDPSLAQWRDRLSGDRS